MDEFDTLTAPDRSPFETKSGGEQLQVIFDTIPTLAWSTDAEGSVEFLNQRWLDYTGLSVEQARGWGWKTALHPNELDWVVDRWRSIIAHAAPAELEARLRRFDGVYRWFIFRATPSFDLQGKVVKWFGANADIEDRKRAELLLAGEKQVLEFVAKGRPLADVLKAFCHHVEAIMPECFCGVMVLDAASSTIEQIMAPSLPSSYTDAFQGQPVDREVSPCMMAAHRKIQVIVPDVEAEMHWDKHGWRSMALAHAVRSCWSIPVLSPAGSVAGTFGIYRKEAGHPAEEDQRIIGQFSHLIAVAIERMRNEAALAKAFDEITKSEAELRTIIDAIPQLIIAIGADGKFLYANQAVLEYTGLTKEEVGSESFGDVFHPEDTVRLQAVRDTAIAQGLPFAYERRLRHRDGRYRWILVQYNPLLDEREKVIRWYATGTDIDDRKRSEDALRSNEQNLRLTVDTIPGLVAVWSAAGELEIANQRTLDYFGLTHGEVINHQANGSHQLIHEDDRERTNSVWRRSVETGEPFSVEHRLRRADGEYRWFHIRGLPLRDSQGRIIRWYKLAVDIDDRRKAEEALRSSQVELAHVSRVVAMGELTASIAHEINRPLAAVVTNGQACLRWLNRAAPDLAEVRTGIERMIHDGIRGNEVIARIRSFLKKEPPERHLIDLNKVIRETAGMVPVPDDGTSLRLELASGLPPVLGDRVQVQQVLLNLIGNAIDAMKSITDAPREVSVRTKASSPAAVVVAIIDNGIGVDPARLDRMFEPFYTTKPDGLGMGLAISRSIVESHGGHLRAEPNTDRGMVFSFTLPVDHGGAA
ncbi:MAG: multi-sensor signal transduction histidine kinase [Verrucomicrobia bacterium]|nr:multi-sensor signal transduction histidine kinase [Verrucomicrobiota bacterium]